MNTVSELARFAHRVTRAEQETRVQEIAAALEDAGAEPAAGASVPGDDGRYRPVILEDVAWSLYSSNFGSMGGRKPGSFDDEDKQRLSDIRQIVGELLNRNSTELSAIRESLEEKQASDLTKEWYTVAEAAKLTKHQPYTIRQAGNLGRIDDKWTKKDIRTGKWRIHRDAITWIQNHGLPPLNP